MKTTIMVTNGAIQVVLKPENETDRHVCRAFREGYAIRKVANADFFETQGGFYRLYIYETNTDEAKDTLIVLGPAETGEVEA